MDSLRAVKSCLNLMNRADRWKLAIVTVAQMLTGLLDLIGILLLGLLAALATSILQDLPPPSALESLLEALGLANLSSDRLLVALAAASAGVLLGRSLLSAFLLRRAFRFLANRQAAISGRLTRMLLSQPLEFIHRKSSQETSYALIQGVGAAVLIVLGQTIVAVSELSLLVILSVGLLFVNPVVALATVAFFLIVAAVIQWLLGAWAARAGRSSMEIDVASLDALQEVLGGYREVLVLNRRGFYADRIQQLRQASATLSANLQLAGALPKYVFEVALVVGALALAVVLFGTQSPEQAAATFAVFLVASTRLLPSVARLQGAFLTLRNASGIAAPTLELAAALDATSEGGSFETASARRPSRDGDEHGDFRPSLFVEDVSYTYPTATSPAIHGISVAVPAGTSLALVGRSGAGKSTLADLILGALEPNSGAITVGGVPPREAIANWPGGIAYVPQSVGVSNSTIRSNVALGLPEDCIDDDMVWEALSSAQLLEMVQRTPKQLDTLVGERGTKLSGGQRQRLGLARALYSRPKLIILDEATSALDAETEQAIGGALSKLNGEVTTVIIAHRLSTVRDSSQVLYLDHGQASAIGTFDEVLREVPALRSQARLMGLQ